VSSAEELFAGSVLGVAVLDRVRAVLAGYDDVTESVSTSQVAFRRRRGFAWLWRPQQYLGDRGADVVLAVALGRRDDSARWKQVVQPSPHHWMHHLEITDAGDVDEQVSAWLHEAADRA
jgi:hypothetical protein